LTITTNTLKWCNAYSHIIQILFHLLSLQLEVDMKMLPEKTVMAVIILSCGLVMNAEPSAQRISAKHATSEGARNWQSLYPEASLHAVRSTRMVRQTESTIDLIRFGKSN
jgi:hypothetical protein